MTSKFTTQMTEKIILKETIMLEPKIYCWWLNNEDMSHNRHNSLNDLRDRSNCEVVFITKDNLKDYILPNYPLHEGYQYLSEIQKGDYLKCYFMHHYGGGYSDIKRTLGSWITFFDELNNNDNLYAIGYGEQAPDHVARLELCDLDPTKSKYFLDVTRNEDGTKWSSEHIVGGWYYLIGNGAFICKKNTPFTTDWWNGLNEKMDGYLEDLKLNPSSWGRDAKDHVIPSTNQMSSYPIRWAVINGNIFHPLTLKYKNHINKNLHYPITSNYQ